MARRTHRYSLLSQRIDRSAFIAYFLGAVVPLLALAWVAHHYALPALPPDTGMLAFLDGHGRITEAGDMQAVFLASA